MNEAAPLYPGLGTPTLSSNPSYTNQPEYSRIDAFDVDRTPPHRRPPSARTTFLSWRFQLAACLLSACAFAALMAVAGVFAGRPLSDWGGSWLSISTVVAVLTTLMKGALMVPIADTVSQSKWAWFGAERGRPLGDLEAIDDASRGTWGSLLWLARRPNPRHVVTVGAALTVLANAFDVFGQQFIRIDVRSVPDRGQVARVMRAENVSASLDPVSWLGAVYAGIYSAEIPELPADCASGNCTWGLVPSVGVCGACFDLTPHMPKDWVKCDRNDFGDDQLHCNYTGTMDPIMGKQRTVLAGAIPQNAVHAPCRPGKDESGESSLANVYTNAIGPGNATWFGKYGPVEALRGLNHSSLSILDVFEVIDVPVTGSSPKKECNFTTGPVSITQCAVWHCIQAFDVRVSLGRQTQTIKEGPPGHYALVRRPGGGDEIANMTLVWDEADLAGLNGRGHTFAVHQTGLPQSYLLGQRFTEAVLSGHPLVDFKDYSNIALAWFNGSSDRAGWIRKLARSLSNELRLAHREPEGAGRDFAGVALSEQAFILVQWAWVAYPALIMCAGLALFAVNVARTHGSGVEVWLTGNIVLLASGLEEDLRREVAGWKGDYEAMANTVGRHRVRMEEDTAKGEWVFKRVKGEMHL